MHLHIPSLKGATSHPTYQRKWRTLVDQAVGEEDESKDCEMQVPVARKDTDFDHTYPATDVEAVNCLPSITDVYHWWPTIKHRIQVLGNASLGSKAVCANR